MRLLFIDLPIHRPTYPYTKTPPIDDVMTLLCGRTITWGIEPRLNSCELTELNCILFRIACYNIFPISRVHTIPIDRCVFLYALITDGSICFSSLFIQIIMEVHRSKSRKQSLYFLVFILRILNFSDLQNFPSLELIHITTPIIATFLRQRSAQKKTIEPSVGSSKRSQVESTVGDMLAEEIPFDPIAAIAKDNVDEVDVDIADATPTVPPPFFLCAMMETFMTTQAAHG